MDKSTEEEECMGLACTKQYFAEYEEVIQLLENVKHIYEKERECEKALEKFLYILDQYCEQPHLLDSRIENILTIPIKIVRDSSIHMKLKHELFKYMWVVIKVRGFKTAVRYLPHEVQDFELVLHLLESCEPQDPNTWKTRYVLLIWMSIIILIPFHMSRFDDNLDKEKISSMDRVFTICKLYATCPDKCSEAASFLMAKFLSRKDVKEKLLSEFFNWTQDIDKDRNCIIVHGKLLCLCQLFKYGRREDLLAHANQLAEWILKSTELTSSDRSILKLYIKLIQRLALIYLKPIIPKWRYQRGNRTILQNLNEKDSEIINEQNNENCGDTDIEDDIFVADQVEDIINELLTGLKSVDVVVRWSAAKGVGRVCGRLPRDYVDDVIGSILEFFNPRESDGAWHGGCLAIAELGRKGYLLPSRLKEVVPLITKALLYDEMRGYTPVGAPIRDAACYVCWSFARAYEKSILEPYVEKIASYLLIVACFDREINCRRAASAAFQENVGRQGTFPHGIEILTVADFFEVGVRTNAYLNVSVFIAQFNEYSRPLIDHLIHYKVGHWDQSIRELTSKALHNLIKFDLEYVSESCIPFLLEKCLSKDLNQRHGSIISIGEIVHAISLLNENLEILNEQTILKLQSLINDLRDRHYFRGMGGELMKQACSVYIEKLSLAKFSFVHPTILSDWLNLLIECFSHEVVQIREKSTNALNAWLNYYYSPSNHQFLKHDDTEHLLLSELELVDLFLSKFKNGNEITRMGYSLVIGALPKFILNKYSKEIITSLLESLKITPGTEKWSQSRRDTIKAISIIIKIIDIDTLLHFEIDIYESLFITVNEYTLESRGDIGAWVREASIQALQIITTTLTNKSIDRSKIFNESIYVLKTFQFLMQQACEKIDRVRSLAGQTFYSLLYNSENRIPNIECYEELQGIFPRDLCDQMNWMNESETFQLFVKALSLKPYAYHVLLGFVVSVGGLTEGLVKKSSSALFEYITNLSITNNQEEIFKICDIIIKIIEQNTKIDRVISTMFAFLDRLFSSGCMNEILYTEDSIQFTNRLIDLIKIETTNCRDMYKLIDSTSVLCHFIPLNNMVSRKALSRLCMLLCNPLKYIRRTTSTKFYETLLLNSEVCFDENQEKVEQVMSLLSENDWENDLQHLRPIRNQICDIIGIVPPVLKK